MAAESLFEVLFLKLIFQEVDSEMLDGFLASILVMRKEKMVAAEKFI